MGSPLAHGGVRRRFDALRRTAAFGAALTHCGARQRGAGVAAIGGALRWQVRLTCDFLK